MPIVRLGRGAHAEPNLRATQIELFDGLYAESQNRMPSLKFDIGAVNSLLSRFFSSRILLQDLYVAGILVDDL